MRKEFISPSQHNPRRFIETVREVIQDHQVEYEPVRQVPETSVSPSEIVATGEQTISIGGQVVYDTEKQLQQARENEARAWIDEIHAAPALEV